MEAFTTVTVFKSDGLESELFLIFLLISLLRSHVCIFTQHVCTVML